MEITLNEVTQKTLLSLEEFLNSEINFYTDESDDILKKQEQIVRLEKCETIIKDDGNYHILILFNLVLNIKESYHPNIHSQTKIIVKRSLLDAIFNILELFPKK